MGRVAESTGPDSGSGVCAIRQHLAGWPATPAYFRLSGSAVRLHQTWSLPVLISQPLPFVKAFVEAIDEAIRVHHPFSPGLSMVQRSWLGLCLMGILVTNSVCWARCERASLGRYSLAALSWMFRHAKLPWALLLQKSVQVVLSQHGITGGSLVVDDADKERSKNTHRLAYVHKLKDKTSGGFLMGQTLVFLLLVTERITVPVGFAFYVPDPMLSAWRQQDKALRKQGVPKRQRPAKPPCNEAYPTKQVLALRLLAQFRHHHPHTTIKAVLADALYGTAHFVDAASAIFGGVQVISQLRRNQTVRFRHRTLSVQQYFERSPGVPQTLRLRGGKEVTAYVSSARLYVCAQGKKRFVMALKYVDEEDYRYLLASDLTWRTQDIIQAFTLRWLVEVFVQDWKTYEGWGALTKQPGEEGSSRSLILSLLVDHCLLLHPAQLAQLNHRQPAYTVGSLVHRIQVDSLLMVIRELLDAEDPEQHFQRLADTLAKHFSLAPSEKHLVGRDLGRLEPTPALKYKAAA